MSRSRRQFLADLAKGPAAWASSGRVWARWRVQQARRCPPRRCARRRPSTKRDFLGACVRCGLCVEACPYDTLKLARLLNP